ENIIESPIEEKADFVISQEVLEHLEDPQTFICGLYEAVRPGGWGYITAAINAGHTDHIYLYRSPKEVEAQIEQAGWKICSRQVEYAYEERPVEKRPTVAGYLTKKV
ncbi:MAG: methyltransferase domain-containing protein, partial [Bdellovibrionales bacterium]|nr:methyltransferase domain-containing protein [Bdellovibrionales bacterium]